MQMMEHKSWKSSIKIFFKNILIWIITFWSFVSFVISIPTFLFNYIGVQVCRYLWFQILSRRASNLEFVRNTTARTAMDTHRNQGIITILLQVKGQCDIDLVKQQIIDKVVEKRKDDGTLEFPHMKMALTSYWLRYAWVTDTEYFSIDNHIKFDRTPTFRNRIINSSNIQEYVSDAITKYMPPWDKNPPWEVRIIVTEPDRFYILARIHHLYISEDGISFGDLLMIKPDEPWMIPADKKDQDNIEQVLETIYQKPTVIPTFYTQIWNNFINKWRELLILNDPLEDSKILKNNPTILEFFNILLITNYNGFLKYENNNSKNISLFSAIKDEAAKRELNYKLLGKCLINSLYIHIFIPRFISLNFRIISAVLQFPVFLTKTIFIFPLIKTIPEIWNLLKLLYISPRVILEELIFPMFQRPKHHLQKISLSGRKVVSWTDSISIKKIKSIRDRTGVASCEIQLYGVAAALHEYFQKYKLLEPEYILTTTRFIPEENILKLAKKISSGLLCLPLPISNIPSDDPLYGLSLVQLAVQDALTTQTALYISSLFQYDYGVLTTIFPSVVARFMLKVLSRRYAVMMTQIETHNKEFQKRNLVWGQEVEAFFYWRPPQANVSMSISLITYGEELRFAIMADAELAPEYNVLIPEYVNRINQLAEEAENYPSTDITPQ